MDSRLEYRREYHRRESVRQRYADRRKTEAYKEWRRKREMIRRRTDPQYRLKHCLKSRMHKYLKRLGVGKAATTYELIGCTPAELRAHLEAQFRPGMTWENHGTLWEVDHIAPISKFNLLDPLEQRRASHYTNLQPLFKWENQAKSNN